MNKLPSKLATLVRETVAHISAADKSASKSEEHYIAAGRCLKRAKEEARTAGLIYGEGRPPKNKTSCCSWPEFVRRHFDLSQEKADELIRISEGRTSLEVIRENRRGRDRSAEIKRLRLAAGEPPDKRKLRPGTSEFSRGGSPEITINKGGSKTEPKKKSNKKPSACDYDWSKPNPKDFDDPSEMYGKQADQYFHEATHLAESLPILADGVDLKVIRSKISGAQAVAVAWRRVVSQLKSRVKRGKHT